VTQSPVEAFLAGARQVTDGLDSEVVERIVQRLVGIRDARGRVFFLGVGGSAANASHAVNDMRKLCGIESYAPTDNVSELTARTNDDGWESTFASWLRTSNLGSRDAIFVLSVGGGSAEHQVSVNLVQAVELARERGATILGIVGRDGGHTAALGDVVVILPTVDVSLVTPLCESFQSVVLHALVSHPDLARAEAKWEGLNESMEARG
jgi:D-sedoheptulose 7-phosphate isomerase